MLRQSNSFPARHSIFNTPFSYPEGKNGFLKTVDIQFSAEQRKHLERIHALCDKRTKLRLPLASARIEEYEQIHALDKQIAELALEAPKELQRLLSDSADKVLTGDERQIRAVWQSFLISNPISM